MSATEMTAFGIAQIPVAAMGITIIVSNYKRDVKIVEKVVAEVLERLRVVAPPKVPAELPPGNKASGYVRDANGRFASRNGAQDNVRELAG